MKGNCTTSAENRWQTEYFPIKYHQQQPVLLRELTMDKNIIRILSNVSAADILHEAEDGQLTAYYNNTEDSPLMYSSRLRETLKAEIKNGLSLYSDSYGCYYAAVRTENDCYFIGPMCHEKLTPFRAKEMVRSYGLSGADVRGFPVFTLPEIRDRTLLLYTSVTGQEADPSLISSTFNLSAYHSDDEKRDQQKFILKEEEENDNVFFRHSYHEELLLLQSVREGRAEDAIRLAEAMDHDIGRLSRNYIRHRRNLAIVGITLCARAAIEGGISPEAGYRISGYYIARLDASQDAAQMLYLRNKAIEDLAGRVAERLNKSASSSYVEKTKDYIRKHYREKIYLADAADSLGISEGYLSRLFRKETGGTFQDYINEERVARAANLLLYSDYSLNQIAEYVNFPNQSYFGKIFKKHKGMTPKAFRDRYGNRESFN